MALVSAVPLNSKLCLCRTLFGFSHELKPIHSTVPNLGMCRGGKSIAPSMSMSSTTSVSNEDGVPRRIAGHHSNLWDDDSIASLSTSYEAPSYRQRADKLIGEVKNIFDLMSVEDGVFTSPLSDLHHRLWMVDSVERLGIDRHFKDEINSALDHVYSYWTEKGIGRGRESGVTDLNSTALGLRTLRLHGYTVSSPVNRAENHRRKPKPPVSYRTTSQRKVVSVHRAPMQLGADSCSSADAGLTSACPIRRKVSSTHLTSPDTRPIVVLLCPPFDLRERTVQFKPVQCTRARRKLIFSIPYV